MDTLKKWFGSAREKAGPAAEKAWERTKDVAEDVAEKARPAAEKAWERTKDVAEDVKDRFEDEDEDESEAPEEK